MHQIKRRSFSVILPIAALCTLTLTIPSSANATDSGGVNLTDVLHDQFPASWSQKIRSVSIGDIDVIASNTYVKAKGSPKEISTREVPASTQLLSNSSDKTRTLSSAALRASVSEQNTQEIQRGFDTGEYIQPPSPYFESDEKLVVSCTSNCAVTDSVTKKKVLDFTRPFEKSSSTVTNTTAHYPVPSFNISVPPRTTATVQVFLKQRKIEGQVALHTEISGDYVANVTLDKKTGPTNSWIVLRGVKGSVYDVVQGAQDDKGKKGPALPQGLSLNEGNKTLGFDGVGVYSATQTSALVLKVTYVSASGAVVPGGFSKSFPIG